MKRILLGITGGIAAYKAVELVRLLTAAHFEVIPIMTKWGARFVGPLTLEALTGHSVRIETPDAGDREGIEHISLVRSAELLLVAPLTANTAAKMANGLADNFLTTTYLAHTGVTVVCPAMNTGMLQHPATQRNLRYLQEDGVHLCHGDSGNLACGEVGQGRMAEPTVIFDFVEALMGQTIPALVGKRVLVSAGPTREDLDPVRYFTNRSSGKMGIAVARAFRNAGARVILVHGPVNEDLPSAHIETIPVVSAEEMATAILTRQANMDIIVMAAAVADYRPSKSEQKLKKNHFDGSLKLQRTIDILACLGERKPVGQILVGFAAESEHLLANAREKLQRKKLDFIFANDISATEIGFASDQNELTMISANGCVENLGKAGKQKLAQRMLELIVASCKNQLK